MPLNRAGATNYYFVWRRQLYPRDGARFLAQFKNDPAAMYDLRRVLKEAFPGEALTLLGDDEALAAVARLLNSGELLVAREEPIRGGSATQADKAQPEPAASAAPVKAAHSAAPESDTLPPNTNGAAQAAALAAAAASGAGVAPT